jgi:hypothetical protein
MMVASVLAGGHHHHHQRVYVSKWVTFAASALLQVRVRVQLGGETYTRRTLLPGCAEHTAPSLLLCVRGARHTQACAGLAYSVSVYLPTVKDALGLSQTQVATVGSSVNLGGYFAVVSGYLYDSLKEHHRLGPRLVVWLGALCCFGGYLGMYLMVAGHTDKDFLHLLLFAAAAGARQAFGWVGGWVGGCGCAAGSMWARRPLQPGRGARGAASRRHTRPWQPSPPARVPRPPPPPALPPSPPGNAGTWFDTSALVTSVRNFPNDRGMVVGVLKSFLGLSSSIFTSIYAWCASWRGDGPQPTCAFYINTHSHGTPAHTHMAAAARSTPSPRARLLPLPAQPCTHSPRPARLHSAFESDARRFLLLLALAPSALTVALSCGLNYVPYVEASEASHAACQRRFMASFVGVGALAVYQMATAVVQGTHPFSQAGRTAAVVVMGGLLALAALLPVPCGSWRASYAHHYIHTRESALDDEDDCSSGDEGDARSWPAAQQPPEFEQAGGRLAAGRAG